MSTSSETRRIVETVPRPRDTTRLLTLLQKILEEEGVQSLTVDKDKDFISYSRLSPIGEAGSFVKELYEAVRNRPMEEYVAESKRPSLRQVADMFRMVSEEGLTVCYILAGSRDRVSSWLELRFQRTQQPSLFGIPIYFDSNIPEDAIILCGAHTRDVYPTDIQFSVKGSL